MVQKKSTATKTTPVKRVTKKATAPAQTVAKAVTPIPSAPARGTWVSIVADKADMILKKPKSWAEWSARQLHENRSK